MSHLWLVVCCVVMAGRLREKGRGCHRLGEVVEMSCWRKLKGTRNRMTPWGTPIGQAEVVLL